MAITYTDINELTDLAPNEISNSSKIQLNSTSCATVSSLAEKTIMIAEANDLIPIHLDLPDDIININEDSSSVTISNWIKKVASNWNDFVNKINTFDGDFDLVSARYVIDAKSIMGIFSLDISAPLRLDIHDDAEYEAVKSSMADFEI